MEQLHVSASALAALIAEELAGEPISELPKDIHPMLERMIEVDASDLHIAAGSPPQIRVGGELVVLPYPPLDPEQAESLLYSVMTDSQRTKLEDAFEVDFSFGLHRVARFRANFYRQRDGLSGAIRRIPWRIPSFEELGLPPITYEIVNNPTGLVLVTGPTGAGKSTSLAAMLDYINKKRRHHIITIEDPIEYVHEHKRCLVNQREIDTNTASFASAMRAAMREDPDVLLVGEMRDLESTELSMRIAETGHLTFATLHTNSAVQSLNRIIDIFPGEQQQQIRTQLSFVLVAIVAQRLLPARRGKRRVLSTEIMIPNAAIRSLIREGKLHQIPALMQSGHLETGMQTLNQSLARLVDAKKISVDTAFANSGDIHELRVLMEKSGKQLSKARAADPAARGAMRRRGRG